MEIELSELKRRIEELPVNARGRRKYTSAVRSDVVGYARRREQQGAGQGRISEELGIHQATLSEWTGRRKKLTRLRRVEVTREPTVRQPVVVLASGARVEGLSLEAIIRLAKALS